MATDLIIDGTTYSQSGRKTNSLVLDGWGWDLDGDYWCEFHEVHRGPTPKYVGPKAVSVVVSGTTRFVGTISNCQPGYGEDGRRWGYRCLGFKYAANYLPVIAVDGSGLMVFNLPAEDEDYVAANSGLSVGDILDAVFTQHSSALSGVGITTDATTASQIAALTLVPHDPVYVSGERLWQAVESVLQKHARNYRLLILPTGLIRLVDITTGTGHTLTSGTDPVEIPHWSRDWTHCATRVVARGRGRIRPAYVSEVGGELVPTWDATDESNWSWEDFAKPGDAYDVGDVTAVGGPTSITIQSDDAALTWATNFWSGRKAWVYLTKTAGTGLTYQEAAPVTACGAMTAGGTCTLTLGLSLDNSGAGAYDRYTLIGKSAQAGAGLVNVYRLYDIVTPGGWVEEHLVHRFPAEVPFVGYTGLSAQNTLVPMAQIIGPSGNGYTQTFRIIPSAGQILFDRPTVEGLNQQGDLDTGGASVVKPADVYVLLAYSRGALEAIYPPDSGGPVYSGTAYSVAGLSRTLYADVDQWLYEGNQSQMTDLAEMIHGSISDTVIDGTIRYKGAYSALYDPSGGHTITTSETDRILSTTVTTTVPVRAFTLRYISDGGGLLYSSEMRCTTRRDPRTDETQYLHLSQLGSGAGAFAGGSPFGDTGMAGRIAENMELKAQLAGVYNKGLGNAYGSAASDAVSGMGAAGSAAAMAGGAYASEAAGGMRDATTGAISGMGEGGGGGQDWGGTGWGGGTNKYRRKRRRRPGHAEGDFT